jgi:general secretion pathway protein A
MKDILTWYSLKRYPFDKSIKTVKALDNGPMRECSARLDYIKRRGGIMLLTGDPGVGKTLALRRFVDALPDNRFRPIYTPLTTLKGTDILRHINDRLGLQSRSSKSVLFTQIQHEVIESKEQRGRTMVLIIDEAQLLQVSTLHELRLLTNFKMDSYDPFILILAGQTDLRRVMDYAVLESFAQRFAMRYHMPPLSAEETAEYVRHHMKLAGVPDEIFCDDALAAIHELTFGIPRRIGALAQQALHYAMFAEKRTVDADITVKAHAGQ